MRRAIIHIGMPRTGSTTFQHILHHHRAGLAAAGILYPELTPRSAAGSPHINHQHFGEALDGRRPRREKAELLDRLAGELRRTDADTVLLSYEGFIQQRLAPGISQLLRSLFDRHGFRMETLAVAKPQAEMLNSLYAHRLQLMLERRVFAGFAAVTERSGRFAYDRLIQPWLSACGGRVRAVPFRDARSPAPLVSRLLAEAGLAERVGPLLGPDDPERVENRSPGPVASEVARRLRWMRAHVRLPVRPREAMRVVERLAKDRGFDEAPFRGVDAALRARLDARFAAANARFAQAVWGRAWPEVAAPEPACPPNELARQPMEATMERHVGSILREACAQFGVPPTRPWTSGPVDLLLDGGEALQRTLRLSRWRVV